MDDPRATSPPHPASHLAQLLSDALKESENLKNQLAAARKRADYAERRIQNIEQIDKDGARRVIEDLEERLRQAEQARDDAEARRRAVQDAVEGLDRYLASTELKLVDARRAYARCFESPERTMGPPPLHRSTPSLASSIGPPQLAGSRRARTPSVDSMYPPSKRLRAEEHRGREPRPSHSEPFYQHHIDHQGRPVRTEARVIERKYHHGQQPHTHHHSASGHSHSASQSSSDLDVDEMLIRASGGEDSRRRDGESPRPINSYPSSNNAYPANQSNPGSMSARNLQQQGSGYQVHVFTPIVTGAPTKKPKFPNTAAPSAPAGPGDAPQAPVAPPSVPYPSTNSQGQRICRQCGMVGRYKDGKCVEKWGPGPMGPGTVCDRCRKKMKRVERRGTLENQQLSGVVHQQQPISRQIPQPQASDRPLHRTDTVPAHVHSSSFSQSVRDDPRTSTASLPSTSAKRHPGSPPPSIAALKEPRDDDDDDQDDQLPGHPPTSNVGRGRSGPALHHRSDSRNGRTGNGAVPAKRLHVTGNGNGTLEMEVDEMDADADAEADADADAELLGAVEAASHDVDDDDEEGDGDGDADADAELLEAVDAAEANSSSSHTDRA